MHRAFVIRKEKDTYLLDLISPYEALYSSVFGVQTDTLSYSQDGMCRRMFDELIEKLNYMEKKVICELYGYGSEKKSISEIARELSLSIDEVEKLRQSALERFRDPENYKYLEKKWYSENDIMSMGYELDYIKKIKSELLRYLNGRNDDVSFIKAIMKRNNISIRRVYRNVNSARSDTDRFEATLVGKRNIDEAVKALRTFKISARPVENVSRTKAQRGNVETVLISQNGVEQAYKYSGLSDEDIVDCIYKVLTDSDEGYGCILNFNISDGLMGLLLAWGYFYMESLVKDRQRIYDLLVGSGFDIQADEFAKFADKADIYIEDRVHSSITFVVVPQTVAKQIYDDEPMDYHELLACAEQADRDFAVMLIRMVNKKFADFAGLMVTEHAEQRLKALDETVEPDISADAV